MGCWKMTGILSIKNLEFLKYVEYFKLLHIKYLVPSVWYLPSGDKV